LMGSTRLWLAGTLSARGDKGPAGALLRQVRREVLVSTARLDRRLGGAGEQHSARLARKRQSHAWHRQRVCVLRAAHRNSEQARREQARIQMTRTMAYGLLERAEYLLSRGGEAPTSAFRERLNATFRERLASLASMHTGT